jgi:hypothetical protein
MGDSVRPAPAGPTAPTWTNLTLTSGFDSYIQPQYRIEYFRVFLRGWIHTNSIIPVSTTISGQLSPPSSARQRTAPSGLRGRTRPARPTGSSASRSRQQGRLIAVRAIGPDTYVNFDGLSWPLS